MNPEEKTLVLAALLSHCEKVLDGAVVAELLAKLSPVGNVQPQADSLRHILTEAQTLAQSENLLANDKGLIPIFDRIELTATQPEEKQHLAWRALIETSSPEVLPFFPAKGEVPEQTQCENHLAQMKVAFDKLCKQLDWEDFDCVYNHLLVLLQTYCWCIPAPYQASPPDVSLYDNNRVTSAIAACLYKILTAPKTAAATRFVMLAGDVSGIQDYLFGISTIGAGGVAKRLRARSFYVQLLSDVASLQVLRAFDLPLANLLIASGGNFFVLLPHLPETTQLLSDLQQRFDKQTLAEFHGALAVNLAWTELSDNDFTAGQFSDVLARVHERLQKRKAQRLQQVLIKEEKWSREFVRHEPFEGERICLSCRRFPAKEKSPGSVEIYICRQCHQQLQLGRKLTKAQYVSFYEQATQENYSCLGLGVTVSENPPQTKPFLIIRLNNPDLRPVAKWPATFRYLANHVPRNADGDPLTFEEIAAEKELTADEQTGKLLGILKADVDFLGLILQEGLRRDGGGFDHISRIAALSRQLDWFFSGWLEWKLSTDEYKYCYSVYSGGDDLLIVGPRVKILALAREIRQAFADYTRNPALHLSAGLVVVKPRLPLAHTVELADRALEKAKENGRNRICLLDDVVTWDLLEKLLPEINSLASCDNGQSSSGFLYHLLSCAELYRQYKHENNFEGLRYHMQLSYQIGRTLKDHPELGAWAKRLRVFPPQGNVATILDHLRMITQWVLLERREK